MPPSARDEASGKDPAAFRTIREVSELLDVQQHVLRFWETRFPELKPLQRGGNRRYYRPSDVAFAAALHKLLHKDGYTVKGVRKLITEHGASNLVAIANGELAGQRVPVAKAEAAQPPVVRPVVQEAANSNILGDLLMLRNRLAEALAA